jgi:hypothetical protein
MLSGLAVVGWVGVACLDAGTVLPGRVLCCMGWYGITCAGTVFGIAWAGTVLPELLRYSVLLGLVRYYLGWYGIIWAA